MSVASLDHGIVGISCLSVPSGHCFLLFALNLRQVSQLLTMFSIALEISGQ